MFEHLFKTEDELEKFTPNERTSYEKSLKYYRDLKNVTDTAKDEGRIEGEIIGEKRGEIKGEIKGVNKVAKNLKALGLPIEQIMQATGLSRAEIENL